MVSIRSYPFDFFAAFNSFINSSMSFFMYSWLPYTIERRWLDRKWESPDFYNDFYRDNCSNFVESPLQYVFSMNSKKSWFRKSSPLSLAVLAISTTGETINTLFILHCALSTTWMAYSKWEHPALHVKMNTRLSSYSFSIRSSISMVSEVASGKIGLSRWEIT